MPPLVSILWEVWIKAMGSLMYITVESNLSLLCPNCHTQTESYGSKNNGRGRGSLKKMRSSFNGRISAFQADSASSILALRSI
jgi:hypothetical protein